MGKDWVLKRLGTIETPDYALQPHIPVIQAGRSKDCSLQFKGQAGKSITFWISRSKIRQTLR